MKTEELYRIIEQKERHINSLEAQNKNLIVDKIDLQEQLALCSVGCSFLKDLISKETLLQTQLSKNLDLYREKGNLVEFDKTFSQWNKCNLVLWDLKDALCRMGIDID